MARFNYNTVYKYKVVIKTLGPLHIGGYIGGSDEILTDPNTGKPFIQASSISGFLRSAGEKCLNSDKVDLLFGARKAEEGSNVNDFRSRVKVSDGIFDSETVKLELRPGVAIDRKTGTANGIDKSGQKYETLFISEGAKAEFYAYYFAENSDEKNEFDAILGVLLGDSSRIGAKKSSGAGKITAERIDKAMYDLTSEDGRQNWIRESTEDKYENITNALKAISGNVKYEIEMKGITEGPIQIKGISMSEFGQDAPDSENIRNGNNDYIIPGSSIKGAVRSQMEKIADYMGKSDVIDSSFGFISTARSNSGNLIFEDVIIGTTEDNDMNPIRNRIHIDKFTGGVMSQAFFKEKNAAGNLDIKIQILDRNNPYATLGLILYALRDLAINSFNLGGGYATGKGFVVDSNIVITEGEKRAEIIIGKDNSEIKDDSSIIQNALKALKEA